MFPDNKDGKPDTPQPAREQLAVRDILSLTTAIALLFAYARSLGTTETALAIHYLGIATLLGVTAGLISGRLMDVLFWCALVSLLAYLAVAGGRLPNFATAVGWGAVGAGCGSYCGWRQSSKKLAFPTLLCGGIAILAMLITILLYQEPITGLMLFDVAAAGVVGMILMPFVTFLRWMESTSGQPRIVLASWLTLVMLLGNFLVPVLTGVER